MSQLRTTVFSPLDPIPPLAPATPTSRSQCSMTVPRTPSLMRMTADCDVPRMRTFLMRTLSAATVTPPWMSRFSTTEPGDVTTTGPEARSAEGLFGPAPSMIDFRVGRFGIATGAAVVGVVGFVVAGGAVGGGLAGALVGGTGFAGGAGFVVCVCGEVLCGF